MNLTDPTGARPAGAPRLRRAAVLCVLTLAAVGAAGTLAACSGDDPSGSGRPSTSSSAVGSVTAVRWWSNAGAKSGSVIDAHRPGAAAAKLHASRAQYCAMLRETLAAGHSILPGVTAADPALLTSTKAFVGELRAVAPREVAGAWTVLGAAVVTLVETHGDAGTVSGVDAAAVRRASADVARDATRSCHVDLSR